MILVTAATGTIGRHLVRALAEADVPFRALVRDARTAGVSWVVKMSAWQPGPDTKLSVRAHWEIEQHLKASGLAWTSLQPTGYMQNFFTGEGGFTHGGALEGPYGAGRVAYIDAYDIAARAAALLTGPPRGGETYALTGPEAPTHEEIARMVRG